MASSVQVHHVSIRPDALDATECAFVDRDAAGAIVAQGRVQFALSSEARDAVVADALAAIAEQRPKADPVDLGAAIDAAKKAEADKDAAEAAAEKARAEVAALDAQIAQKRAELASLAKPADAPDGRP